jgi:hypothetical protein
MIDVYLAVPYSDPVEEVRVDRYEITTRYAARLVLAGLTVYSPITHSHPMIERCPSLGLDWEFWAKMDREYLMMCSELRVLCLPGWECSRGVAAEVAMFTERMGKHAVYLELVGQDEWRTIQAGGKR